MDRPSIFLSFTWNSSGVGQHFIYLAEGLARSGFFVVCISDQQRFPSPKHHSENIMVYSWPSYRPTKIKDAKFLYNLILKFKPKCVVGNFGSVNLMLVVGFLARVPVRVAWQHTISKALAIDDVEEKKERRSFSSIFHNFRKKVIFKLATQIVVNSQATLNDVLENFGVPLNKCKVFFNSVQSPGNGLLPSGPSSKKYFFCPGALFPRKGQDVLLYAFEIIKDKYPNVELEFAGAGPDKDRLILLSESLNIKEKCRFWGSIPRVEIFEKMRDAIATIVPSRFEAFGFVVIESFAVGTPVIGSAEGGLLEIIFHEKNGFLFPVGDQVTLSNYLEKFLVNPELKRILGANAREDFLTRFDQKKSLEVQLTWFATLIQ